MHPIITLLVQESNRMSITNKNNYCKLNKLVKKFHLCTYLNKN